VPKLFYTPNDRRAPTSDKWGDLVSPRVKKFCDEIQVVAHYWYGVTWDEGVNATGKAERKRAHQLSARNSIRRSSFVEYVGKGKIPFKSNCLIDLGRVFEKLGQNSEEITIPLADSGEAA